MKPVSPLAVLTPADFDALSPAGKVALMLELGVLPRLASAPRALCPTCAALVRERLGL